MTQLRRTVQVGDALEITEVTGRVGCRWYRVDSLQKALAAFQDDLCQPLQFTSMAQIYANMLNDLKPCEGLKDAARMATLFRLIHQNLTKCLEQ